MSIRSLRHVLALGALGAPLFFGTASAAEYAVIHLQTSVDAPIDVVWKKVGGYCDITKWLPQLNTCVYTTGDGDIGTVRRLADRIDELMVAKTAYSYTYAQPNGPGLTTLYHGTLEAVPDGKKKTKLLYSIVWDQASQPDAAAKQKEKDTRTTSFTTALANMKNLAEGKPVAAPRPPPK